MKTKSILELLESKSLIIPGYLLKNYKNLNLDFKEILFLSLLIESSNESNIKSFDPTIISKTLDITIPEVMEIVSNLCEKNIIELAVYKENNKMEEVLKLDNLYNKILSNSMEKEPKQEEKTSKIYEEIEKEFGRTLSPIEYELVSEWLNSNINEELIKEALKEAVLNGVTNLKYIDKILFEWNRKGYKTKNDVKNKNKKTKKDEQIFEYDWLDENV